MSWNIAGVTAQIRSLPFAVSPEISHRGLRRSARTNEKRGTFLKYRSNFFNVGVNTLKPACTSIWRRTIQTRWDTSHFRAIVKIGTFRSWCQRSASR